MTILQKYFRYWELQSGGLVAGYLAIIHSIIVIWRRSKDIKKSNYDNLVTNKPDITEDESKILRVTTFLSWCIIAIFVFSIILDCILIFGVTKRKEKYLLYWVILRALTLLLFVSLMLIAGINWVQLKNFDIILYSVGAVWIIYHLLIVFSLYQHYKKSSTTWQTAAATT